MRWKLFRVTIGQLIVGSIRIEFRWSSFFRICTLGKRADLQSPSISETDSLKLFRWFRSVWSVAIFTAGEDLLSTVEEVPSGIEKSILNAVFLDWMTRLQ
jgi:hypothetical protein